MDAGKQLINITGHSGTFHRSIGDPAGRPISHEIAIIDEHRFAFYYWSRWFVRKLQINQLFAPVLVTIDWHQDLAPPNEKEKEELNLLHLRDDMEVREFCNGQMNPYNDGHILSAAWLGIISNIVVICKQKFRSLDQFIDASGRIHTIRKCTGFKEAREEIEDSERVILDIDLDYFTESSSFRGGDQGVRLDTDENIRSVLDPESDFFKTVFDRFFGMTIATEPGFCGSRENAQHILAILNEQFFDMPLTNPRCNWRKRVINHHNDEI